MSDAPADSAAPRRSVLVGVGLFLILLGGVLWTEASRLPTPQTVGVGPSAGLRLVGALVAILGAAHLVAALRARTAARLAAPASHAVGANRVALGWVLGALFGMMLILEVGGGFVFASAWLFVATAAAFGQRIRLLSPLLGLGLSLAVYAFFTQAMALSLPSGPLERLLFG